MKHNHETKTTKQLLGAVVLHECECGARKRSDGKKIYGGTKVGDWYVARKSESNAYEMLQTEGHGYDYDVSDPLDSHHPNLD